MDKNKILFLDIETHRVLEWTQLDKLSKRAFENHLWNKDVYQKVEDAYIDGSGLHAEFSKVICVSMGCFVNDQFKMFSLSGKNEIELLTSLKSYLDRFNSQGYVLCGHNIKRFDIPYLCKRYIINNMKVPKCLNKMGLKPWDISDIDTLEMWKFSGGNNISLEVICSSLGISSKSTSVTGTNLYTYNINDIDFVELVKYCEEDVNCCRLIYERIIDCL